MSHFSVDIFTPSRVLEKNLPVDSLSIPTCRGEIQVLPEHTHLITKIDTGVLTLRAKDKDRHYLVTRGVCKILGNKVVILSKSSEKAENIDEQSARELAQRVQQRLASGEPMSDDEYEGLQQKGREAQVKLQLAGMKKTT